MDPEAAINDKTMNITSPYLLYSDGKGNIFEDKTLYATGRAGFCLSAIPCFFARARYRGFSFCARVGEV